MGMKRFDAGIGVGVAYEINKFFVDLLVNLVWLN
mgnify:CR=1 FL=1